MKTLYSIINLHDVFGLPTQRSKSKDVEKQYL